MSIRHNRETEIMKDYKLTFGIGDEVVIVTERCCSTFTDACSRLEEAGWEMHELTNVEATDSENDDRPELSFSLGFIGHKAEKIKALFEGYSEDENEFGYFLRISDYSELVVNQGVMVHTNCFYSKAHFEEQMNTKIQMNL